MLCSVDGIVIIGHSRLCWHAVKSARIKFFSFGCVAIIVSFHAFARSIASGLDRTSRLLLNLGVIEAVIGLEHNDLVVAFILRILGMARNPALGSDLAWAARDMMFLILNWIILLRPL